MLKEEGDLATIVGDTASAIAAYSRYLTFPADPDDLPFLTRDQRPCEILCPRTVLTGRFPGASEAGPECLFQVRSLDGGDNPPVHEEI